MSFIFLRIVLVSGTGSEQFRSYKHAYNNQGIARRPPTNHSFKHVEFTALSPVPSHGSSTENSINDISISRYKTDDRLSENSNAVKRKGGYSIFLLYKMI